MRRCFDVGRGTSKGKYWLALNVVDAQFDKDSLEFGGH